MSSSALKTYFGGKNGSGSYQAIINQIPPHHMFVELFAGSAGVTRNKRPAVKTIIMEKDESLRPYYEELGFRDMMEGSWLQTWRDPTNKIVGLDKHFHGGYYKICDAILELDLNGCMEFLDRPGVFIYADPPYPLDSRKTRRNRYKHEMSDDDHRDLLQGLCNIEHAQVAISTYPNEIYWDFLMERAYSWRVIEFEARTQGGTGIEQLWMNYDEPDELHDYRYLGSDYRHRENIARQQRRWLRKLKQMPILEQRAMVAALQESF